MNVGWSKASQKTGCDGRYLPVDFDRTDHASVAQALGVKAWRGKNADAAIQRKVVRA
jgi:hypothetical protein